MRTRACPILTQVASCACATFIAFLFCGCATPALWRSTAATQWHPRPPAEVLLLSTTNESGRVGFTFTQFCMAGKACKTRAVLWLPGESPTSLIVGDPAIRAFLTSQAASHLPVYGPGGEPSGSDADIGGYALKDATGLTLTLHADGISREPYTLPSTTQKAQTTTRIIGLPFAVAVDAALLTGAVAIGVAAEGATSGGDFAPTFK